VALRLAGFPVGGFRPPLAEPGPEIVAQLRQVLASYQLLNF